MATSSELCSLPSKLILASVLLGAELSFALSAPVETKCISFGFPHSTTLPVPCSGDQACQGPLGIGTAAQSVSPSLAFCGLRKNEQPVGMQARER